MACASSILRVPAPPQPVRMPLAVVLPEKIRMTFSPRLAICASTCAFAPLPMLTMAITAPTPMMIPSAVSADRSLLRRNARPAILNVDASLIRQASGNHRLRRRFVQLLQLRDGVQALRHHSVGHNPAVAHDDIAPAIRGDVRLMRDHDDGDAVV